MKNDHTLSIEGCNFFLRVGAERYTLVIRIEGDDMTFVLEQETPRETAPGIIDADPQGTIRVGAEGGFVASYAYGWEPSARLQAIIQEAFDSMSVAARPGHMRPRAPAGSDAN